MAWLNTGKQKSLTFTLKKLINGVVVQTTTYDGLLSFGSYPTITAQDMARLSQSSYLERLEAFKKYVEDIESGLVVDECIVSDSEPYRTNTTACPIGA